MGTTAVNRTVVTFRDARGFTALHTYNINVLEVVDRYAAAAAIFGPLGNLSVAAIQASSGLYQTPGLPLLRGGTNVYQSVYDKIDMVFSTDQGGLYHLLIPAPFYGLFQADGETVDAGNPDVLDWVNAMLANGACAKNGDLYTAWITGTLKRTSHPRRLSSLTLNAALTGPGW